MQESPSQRTLTQEFQQDSPADELYVLPPMEEKDVKLDAIDKSSVFQYEPEVK